MVRLRLKVILFCLMSTGLLQGCSIGSWVGDAVMIGTMGLKLTGAQSISSNTCVGPYQASLQKSDGTTASADISYSIAAERTGNAQLYSDSSCLTALGASLTIQEGASSASFYLKTTVSEAFEVTVSNSKLGSKTITVTVVSGPPDHLEVVAGSGQSGVVGTVLPTSPRVRVVDASGNPVPGVAVEFLLGTGGGSISSVTVLTNADGEASAQWTLGTLAGTNELTVSAASFLTGTPTSLGFTATALPGPAAQLVWTVQPSGGVAGEVWVDDGVIEIQDQYGNLIDTGPDATAMVTLSVQSGTGSLSGTAARSAVAGVADFSSSDFSMTSVGTKIIRASKASTLGAGGSAALTKDSEPLAITHGAMDSLTITGFPSSTTAGASHDVTVAALDVYGNPVTSYTGTVTLSTTNGAAVLPGAHAYGASDAGVYVFKDVELQEAGTGFSLTASDGTETASITSIAVSPAAPDASKSSLVADYQDVANDGVTATGFTITLIDAYDNPIPDTSVTLAATGSGNTLVQPLGQTNSSGILVGGSLASSVSGTKTVTLTAPAVGGLSVAVDFSPVEIWITDSSGFVGSDLVFTVSQNVVRNAATTFNYATSDGTALAGIDYTGTAGTGSLSAYALSTTIAVPTADLIHESTRSLSMAISAASAGTISDASATGTLSDTSLALDFMNGSLPSGVTFTRTTGGHHIGSTGYYTYVGNNTPRFEYDPITLVPKGLLIEKSSTNSFLYSHDFSNVVWAKTGFSYSQNGQSVFTPFNFQDAMLLRESSVWENHRISQTVAGFPGNTFAAFSIFVKPAETNPVRYVRMRVVAPDGDISADFDLRIGKVLSSTSSGAAETYEQGAIVPYRDGWHRISVSGIPTTTVANVSLSADLSFQATGGGGTSYTGDGARGLYISDAQMEYHRTSPTSPLRTTGGSSLRAADLVTINSFSSWFNPGAWSTFIEFSRPAIEDSSVNTTFNLVSFNDGLATPQDEIRLSNSTLGRSINLHLTSNGSQTFGAYQAGVSLPYQIYQSIVSLDTSTSKVSLGGQTPASGAIADTTGFALNTALMGGSSGINAHVRRLTYRARPLSDAHLQTLTDDYVPSDATSTISVDGPGTADGVTPVTVTITLKNSAGGPIPLVQPTFTASGTGNTIYACGTANSSGVATCLLTSSTAEVKTLTLSSPSGLTAVTTTVTFF